MLRNLQKVDYKFNLLSFQKREINSDSVIFFFSVYFLSYAGFLCFFKFAHYKVAST